MQNGYPDGYFYICITIVLTLMSYINRKKIIDKIEKIRGTKVLTYVISTRPQINTMVEPADLRVIFDHLNDESFQNQNIDLFIYSNGGVSTVAWALANLIRENTDKFSVLIPYNAFSCATSIAIGADEIVMTKMGSLGPIDPTVTNHFNPIIENQRVGISVEDMAGYLSLFQDKFEIKEADNLTKAFEILATDIRPLALGNAYRHYIKCRDDAKKLLTLHLDQEKDEAKINKIISILVEELYYHGHHVNRKEGKSIGLNVKDAEEISDDLPKLMWDLYLEYENDMKLQIPYKDELPEKDDAKIELPIKYVESTVHSSSYIIEQDWINVDAPEGSTLIDNGGKFAIFAPPSTVIPAIFRGQPVFIDGKIYDKQEISYWKTAG